jgi:hypothetical protein
MEEFHPAEFFRILDETVEDPVRKAVYATLLERTASSGFHQFHTPPAWGIVYEGKASERIRRAAESTGLKIRERQHKYLPSDAWVTDVYLEGVGEDERDKAKEIFDRFAVAYTEK